jgi:hypothetical protein
MQQRWDYEKETMGQRSCWEFDLDCAAFRDFIFSPGLQDVVLSEDSE